MSEVPLAEDLVFTGPVASFDSADGLRVMVRDGRIVRGELIYDAEELRRAMAAQAPTNAG